MRVRAMSMPAVLRSSCHLRGEPVRTGPVCARTRMCDEATSEASGSRAALAACGSRASRSRTSEPRARSRSCGRIIKRTRLINFKFYLDRLCYCLVPGSFHHPGVDSPQHYPNKRFLRGSRHRVGSRNRSSTAT